MEVIDTKLSGLKLIQPRLIADSRGWFAEVYNKRTFAEHQLPTEFVQDNQSYSSRGVLRGLHYQLGKPQGKLVRVLSGHIWDVAVDLRRGSPSFGRWAGFDLKPDPLQLLWLPEGFAHGFLVLSDSAEVLYKTTDYYDPPSERCIAWNDPTLNIAWPLALIGRGAGGSGAGAASGWTHDQEPLIHPKDARAPSFLEAELPA